VISPEILQAVGAPVSYEHVAGGAISDAFRLTFSDGSSAILKVCRTPDPPEDMFTAEAVGLKALKLDGTPRTPEVMAIGRQYLCLEDLGTASKKIDGYWERFGREVAHLHSHRSERFGFEIRNYLGRAPMENRWRSDGHEFFIETRLLTFLTFPLCEEYMTEKDRRSTERICELIRTEIPEQGPCLLHGDLWFENTLAGPHGEPCFIDPATYYGWPEAELSMAMQYPGIEPPFFDAYREVRPLLPGWERRLRLLQVRELLSMIAHYGDAYGTVHKLRALFDEFLA
jgi:fructosamine-3-kinase